MQRCLNIKFSYKKIHKSKTPFFTYIDWLKINLSHIYLTPYSWILTYTKTIELIFIVLNYICHKTNKFWFHFGFISFNSCMINCYLVWFLLFYCCYKILYYFFGCYLKYITNYFNMMYEFLRASGREGK